MVKCKSGMHEWFYPEDAQKCCNGFKRILVIGDTSECTNIGHVPLPGGKLYGYKWIKDV